jgi:tousled-like kinase
VYSSSTNVSSVPQKLVRISPKVDVWSAGVVMYQMLYGKRPFGHDQTPHGILASQTILHAFDVKFPEEVVVSNEAKV